MKKSKVLAVLLVLMLVLAMLPGSVLALPDEQTVVRTERVYLAMASGAGAFTDTIPNSIPSGTGTSGKSTNGNIRTYNNAFFLDSDAPTAKQELKVATDCIQVQARGVSGLGPYTGEHINNVGIYEFGFNADGVAVTHLRLLFDPYTGYGAPDTINKTIRIGQFGAAAGDLHNTYNYDENTKAYIVTGSNATLALTPKDFENLVQDENDTIRIFYDYKGMTDKTLTEVFITETAGVGARAATYENRYWVEGVHWSDPVYGYDGVENPWPVQFSLSSPIDHRGKTDDAKYPLFIFYHGIGGGGSKTGVAGNDGWNIGNNYQNLFESNTEGINGAYVLSARSTVEIATTGGQGWLNGYREDSNPRYAAGDESYKGKCTQAAAMIANIEWLLDNDPNIDRNRVYMTSHSAGGYMVWSVLFEAARQGKSDLFAAAIPNQAAFFPSGAQIVTDYSEFELGLEEKLLSVKNTPIWLQSSIRDGTCAWAYSTGDTFRMTDDTSFTMTVQVNVNPKGYPEYVMPKIGNARTLYEAVAKLKDVGGSPLSRVSIHMTLGHADTVMTNNNIYPANTGARQGVRPTTYTAIYGEQADWDAYVLGSSATTTAYSFGSHAGYSDGSYEDSITDWFNACGYAKAKAVVGTYAYAYVDKLNGNQNRLWVAVEEYHADGTTTCYTMSFMIDKNSAGKYTVGEYIVYVDTKGNDQVRSCYIMP